MNTKRLALFLSALLFGASSNAQIISFQSCPSASNYATNTPVAYGTYVPVDTFQPGWVSDCSGPDSIAPCAKHKVYVPSGTPLRSPLVVFLPGSSMEPYQHDKVLKTAAYAGYRTIGLSYDSRNNVEQTCGITSCDIECHGPMRREIILGTDESSITVEPADSIVWRLYAVLEHLYNEDIADGVNDYGWDGYYTPLAAGSDPALDNIDWTQVIVSGFSQGAGHAAMISKLAEVQGVVMLDGPGDVCETAGVEKAAPWLSDPVDLSAARPRYGVMHHSWFSYLGVAEQPHVTWRALGIGPCALEDLDGAFLMVPPRDAAYTAQELVPTCPGIGATADMREQSRKHGSMAEDTCMPEDATGGVQATSPNDTHLFSAYLRRFCHACHACDAATCP